MRLLFVGLAEHRDRTDRPARNDAARCRRTLASYGAGGDCQRDFRRHRHTHAQSTDYRTTHERGFGAGLVSW